MEKYIPPFDITNTMLAKISNIMEKIGKLDNYSILDKTPHLRKQNRINSIHSSLAIENNRLSLEQVNNIVNGKVVLGPQKEVQEVKNAYKAYELLQDIDIYSIEDLKKIHGIMTFLTVEDAGRFRTNPEGVFDDDKCIFMCPPEIRVNSLITSLFNWMKEKKNEIHPLILSSVFHYEFVFIHPFSDGNGRTARLWQTALLYNWKNIFQYIPMESQIHRYQDEYYKAIAGSHLNGNSNLFIEFMLDVIDKTLNEAMTTPLTVDNETINLNKLLNVMDSNNPLTATELMARLGVRSKEILRSKYLDEALKSELIKITMPDDPTSKNQKYYKLK